MINETILIIGEDDIRQRDVSLRMTANEKDDASLSRKNDGSRSIILRVIKCYSRLSSVSELDAKE